MERSRRRPNHRLRRQRELRGWTQWDMADRMHEAGSPLSVDAGMIGRWERGERRPSAPYVGVLTQVFDLPAAELGLLEEAASASSHGTLMEALAAMESDLERREFLRQVATAMLGSTAVGGALHPLQMEPWVSPATSMGPLGDLCCHIDGTTRLPVMGPPRSSRSRSN